MRRLLLLLIGTCLAVAVAAPQATAQGWPDRPIRIIVPFPAGGAADLQTRAFAEAFGSALGQRVVVDNRSGAAGNIGTEAAVRAPADGTTLVIGGPNVVNNRYLFRDTPFVWERDLMPLGLMFANPNVLVVHPSIPATTVGQFIAHLRANPGRLNFGSAGVGGSIHLSALLFMQMTGTEMVHVPYRGDALARADLSTGAIHVMFNAIPSSLDPVRLGQWRAIATTGLTRAAAMPDLPTLQEAGLEGFVVMSWQGLFAPAGVPAAVVARIREGFDAAFASEEARAQFGRLGTTPAPSRPAEHLAFMQAQERVWAPVLRQVSPQ